tara:strand:+ start:514 stop:819 length:306 start_codon:yes stop_codon:yes gene_type:complete
MRQGANNKSSRYRVGVINYSHRGKTVTSTVGSESFDRYIATVGRSEYDLGRIPAGYDSRPDLISHLFFGKTDLWWRIMVINGIPDPFEGLAVGNQILLPKR